MMSRKPQTTSEHHDGTAPNCVAHAAVVRAGWRANPDRTCVRCLRDARNATRRRAVRS